MNEKQFNSWSKQKIRGFVLPLFTTMMLVFSMGLILYYYKIFSIDLVIITTLIASAFQVKLWKENEKKLHMQSKVNCPYEKGDAFVDD
ncbi:hypothetical protein [Paenibacillus sp. PL2-23]|uniref:hypothetical protein n=1 Tax=Paenibacillus sp. PL2-23 TaxID=2100729 RepID=UPI0030F4D5F1